MFAAVLVIFLIWFSWTRTALDGKKSIIADGILFRFHQAARQHRILKGHRPLMLGSADVLSQFPCCLFFSEQFSTSIIYIFFFSLEIVGDIKRKWLVTDYSEGQIVLDS